MGQQGIPEVNLRVRARPVPYPCDTPTPTLAVMVAGLGGWWPLLSTYCEAIDIAVGGDQCVTHACSGIGKSCRRACQ